MYTALTTIKIKHTSAEFRRKLNKLTQRFRSLREWLCRSCFTIYDSHLFCNYILRSCYKYFRYASRKLYMTHRSRSKESPKVAAKFHHTWLCKQLNWKDHVVNRHVVSGELLTGFIDDSFGDRLLRWHYFNLPRPLEFKFSFYGSFKSVCYEVITQMKRALCNLYFLIEFLTLFKFV